eukprot:997321-Amphidinium_carterae.1
MVLFKFGALRFLITEVRSSSYRHPDPRPLLDRVIFYDLVCWLTLDWSWLLPPTYCNLLPWGSEAGQKLPFL